MNGVTSFGDAIQCPEINTSSFLKKGTDIDMQSKKITNCAEGTEEDDVVTIKGLNVYYRKGTALDLQGQRIKNVATGTKSTDAANVGQITEIIKNFMYVKEGVIGVGRQMNGCYLLLSFSEIINPSSSTCTPRPNYPTIVNCLSHPRVIPISLFINSGGETMGYGPMIRSYGDKWVQEPFILAANAIFFYETNLNRSPNSRYLFFYFMSPDVTASHTLINRMN